MLVDRQLYDLFRRRAAKSVYDKFRVNRFELGLLDQLSALLRIEKVHYISKHKLFGTVTSNSREKYKMEGYLKGLFRLQLVGSFEYIKVPGSVSLGISDLGAEVIKQYQASLERYFEQYKADHTATPLSSNANNSMYRPNIAA